MPTNLQNPAVDTGLEKVSFHYNSKERQHQRMFTLLKNCTYFICQQSNAQNSLGQASTVCELRTSRCIELPDALNLEKTEESEIKLPTSIGSQRKQGNSRKTSTSAFLTTIKPLTVWSQLQKIQSKTLSQPMKQTYMFIWNSLAFSKIQQMLAI